MHASNPCREVRRGYCCGVGSLRLAWATLQAHTLQRVVEDVGISRQTAYRACAKPWVHPQDYLNSVASFPVVPALRRWR